MKYVFQFAVIISVSFAGEILNAILPFPVPASIYGMAILFLLLKSGALKISQVKDASDFLLSVMPVMFVPSSVALMTSAEILKKFGVQFFVIAVVTTFSVMIVTGRTAQFLIRRKKSEKKSEEKK
jgi:holin-like protein